MLFSSLESTTDAVYNIYTIFSTPLLSLIIARVLFVQPSLTQSDQVSDFNLIPWVVSLSSWSSIKWFKLDLVVSLSYVFSNHRNVIWYLLLGEVMYKCYNWTSCSNFSTIVSTVINHGMKLALRGRRENRKKSSLNLLIKWTLKINFCLPPDVYARSPKQLLYF